MTQPFRLHGRLNHDTMLHMAQLAGRDSLPSRGVCTLTATWKSRPWRPQNVEPHCRCHSLHPHPSSEAPHPSSRLQHGPLSVLAIFGGQAYARGPWVWAGGPGLPRQGGPGRKAPKPPFPGARGGRAGDPSLEHSLFYSGAINHVNHQGK